MKGSAMNILVTTRTGQQVTKLKGSFRRTVIKDLEAQERKNRKDNRSCNKAKSTFQSLINRITLAVRRRKSEIPARA